MDLHQTTYLMTWLLVIFLLVYLVSHVSSKERRKANGERGEDLVRHILTQAFPSSEYHLLNNVTLPFMGGTTQIDHILVSTRGVFVIEVKDYSGWIFADERSRTWTQVIYHWKKSFQNPLHQNYKHLIAVRQLLDFLPGTQVHSAVVFTGSAVFKKEMPRNVFDPKGLVELVRSFPPEQIISVNRMAFIVGRLECARYRLTHQTDVEHQAYLDRKFGSTD